MVSAPTWAPELGVMTLPSMTSMNHLSSLYWVLLQSSPREMPKSKGVLLVQRVDRLHGGVEDVGRRENDRRIGPA